MNVGGKEEREEGGKEEREGWREKRESPCVYHAYTYHFFTIKVLICQCSHLTIEIVTIRL